MQSRPQWKSSYYVEVLEPENVCLLTETEYTLLSGRAYCLLAPLLNGQHTIADLISCLEGQVSPPELYYALHLLELGGHLIEASNELPPEVVAFWHTLNVDATTVSMRLQETPVSVRAIGTVDATPLNTLLEGFNVQISPDANFEIVLTDDYLREELAALNHQYLQEERVWVLVKPVGRKLWIGPIFRPNVTGCWACLAQRLQANRQMETYLLNRKGTSTPLLTSRATLPTTMHAALQLAVTQIVKALVIGQNDTLDGTVITLDALSLETQKHTLVRRPQCRACGDLKEYSANRSPEPIVLQTRKKAFTADGGHRSVLPEVTLRNYQHHVSPITGVVSSLTRTSVDEDEGHIYSYNAGHNFALMNNNLFYLLKNLRGRSGGKGMTDIQAKVSGICEAIERYSGVFSGDEISKRASYSKLKPIALHPNALMNFSDEQYRNRKSWNLTQKSSYHVVPEPFDPEREISWVPVWSLTDHEFRYVPTAYCYYGHPDLKEQFFCTCDANGNAAGNNKEEATLQGFLELIERDSVAIWWYNRVQRPAVNLESFDDPYFVMLQEFYKTIHRDIWVLDITNDLGIPAFAAVSRRTDKSIEDIALGFGAHLDPKLAIMRALTEVNQFLPALRKTAADGSTIYWFDDQEAVQWWKTATLETNPYLIPDKHQPLKCASNYTQLSSDDLFTDVQTCVDILKQHGMQAFVLDQTRPDIGLAVVKVIVPGLRHFWKRFGPGRLYEVPVALGWIPEPRDEAHLNPIGMFF